MSFLKHSPLLSILLQVLHLHVGFPFKLPQGTFLTHYEQILIIVDQLYNLSLIVLLTYIFVLHSVSYTMQVPGCNPGYESGKLNLDFNLTVVSLSYTEVIGPLRSCAFWCTM